MQITYTLDQIDSAARTVAQAVGRSRHIAFDAPMGTGKTTFIKALCRYWGVREEVNSPTFAIVNEYESTQGPIYHFDFYRIRTPQEAIDLGLFDYIDSPGICLFEWPECVENLLPDDTLTIQITQIDTLTRRLTLNTKP